MPELRTPAYVAESLGISPTVARRLMESGRIRSVNIGEPGARDQWRTTDRYIEEWLASAGREQQQSAPPPETRGGVQVISATFNQQRAA